MLTLDIRHPGLIEKVDAMFERFATINEVTAMIRAQYGEHISHGAMWNYKTQFVDARRKRVQAAQAALTAYQELLNEGRN